MFSLLRGAKQCSRTRHLHNSQIGRLDRKAKGCVLTYLLTPQSRVLLEKPTGLKLVKKFPAFYGTRSLITAFTSARQLPLSWASSIQSMFLHPTSWRYILILSFHLCLGLPSVIFPSGFPTKTLYTPHQFVASKFINPTFASCNISNKTAGELFGISCDRNLT